jgi:hypothetical protein
VPSSSWSKKSTFLFKKLFQEVSTYCSETCKSETGSAGLPWELWASDLHISAVRKRLLLG